MFGVKLRVYGDYACFTRPEMKVERVTYDVITPSSARGILEAIHWKPAIKWIVDEIIVCKPIEFTNIKRNERKSVIPKIPEKALLGEEIQELRSKGLSEDIEQRNSIILKNVEYIIKAHFELTNLVGEEDNEEKHYNIFLRRARKGQCFNQPYFGCREFSAKFELLDDKKDVQGIEESRDLGYMLYDIDYKNGMKPMFFRAKMERGVILVPGKDRVIL